MKTLILLSGGIDSVTALYYTLQEHSVTAALSFHYGSKHNDQELKFAAWHANQTGIHHEIISLDFINKLFKSDLLRSGGEIPEGRYNQENMQSTVVPFRNGIMLSIAAGLAESLGAEAIVIAAHSGDHAIYPDCRNDFLLKMEAAITAGTYAGIRILAPFANVDKTEIIRRGAKLGIDYSQTWSCYCGGTLHCGHCGTCTERKESFALAGIPDPTLYKE